MTFALVRNAGLAAAVVLAGSLATFQSAEALTLCAPPCSPGPPTVHPHHHSHHGINTTEAAILGVVGGVILGTTLANRRSNAATAEQLHDDWCDAHYNTYNRITNKYMSFSGPKYCNSPYN